MYLTFFNKILSTKLDAKFGLVLILSVLESKNCCIVYQQTLHFGLKA